jgi:hypothetical protein
LRAIKFTHATGSAKRAGGTLDFFLAACASESDEVRMILAPLFGIGLVTVVALGPALDPDPSSMSGAEKRAAVERLVGRATECIVQRIAADPRYRGAHDLGDLVIDALPPCMTPVRAMVEGYDDYFGVGSGEKFFIGPFLRRLATALNGRT